ncbi:MAG: hypothetical protein FJ267_12770, partial [Planctomycetes bacterium]|nr:hypothetical protein [Planctomycetota bacterium]
MTRSLRTTLSIILIGITFSLTIYSVDAGDWPQILGPNRNGIALNETLGDKWPAEGPNTVWEAKIGSGFSGVAVSEGMVILFHRIQDEDVLTAFHAVTGETLWSQKYPSNFQPSIVGDNGPRSVPTIASGKVIA